MALATASTMADIIGNNSNGFICRDGTIIQSIPALADKLRNIPEEEFSYFVNEQKNDFAYWVKESLKDEALGNLLLSAHSRERMIGVLSAYQAMRAHGGDLEAKIHEPPVKIVQPPPEPKNETLVMPPVQVAPPEPEPIIAPPQSQPAPQPVPIPIAAEPETQPMEITNPTTEKSVQEPMKLELFSPRSKESASPPVQPATAPEPEKEGFYQPPGEPPESETPAAPPQEAPPARYASQPPINIPAIGAPDIDQLSIDPLKFMAPPGAMTHDGSKDLNAHHDDEDRILDERDVTRFADWVEKAKEEIDKVFIGQDKVVHSVILALMCDAHALLEGVPGLAKSLLVEVLTRVISGTTFHRIQFMPDMLPSDVIGGQIYNPKTSTFVTVKGPIFANFILADEINRAPPKTHAALMEAMQEKKINIDKEEYILDRPFLVLATMNPLENKGTYALPEAVLDRFMFKIDLTYPDREHEKIIITENATTKSSIKRRVNHVMNKEEFLDMQAKVRRVYLSEAIKDYILNLVEATRGLNKKVVGMQFVKWGGGPRASIYLGIAAKAQAITQGRNYVLPEDVASVAKDLLRHRVALNFKGKAHNVSPDKVIDEILAKVNAL
ncbi:MAG: MoxR family ATPase [archaeon]